MSWLRLLLALALVLVLSLDASAAGGKKDKKKAKKPITGVVTAVTRDKDNGTITVKVGSGKKAPVAAEAAPERKFTITKDTKFEKVVGKKAGGGTTPARFAEIKPKSKVRVTLEAGDTAKLVQFQAKGKKKAKG
jgi:hypothetical protein